MHHHYAAFSHSTNYFLNQNHTVSKKYYVTFLQDKEVSLLPDTFTHDILY